MALTATPVSRPATLFGAAVTVLGITVLMGWHTHNLRLIHIFPTFVGMAYNTALGFLLCGAGLSAAGLGRRRFSALVGGLGLLLGLLTLGEYASGVSLGIDQLFMKAYTRAGILDYGRMAFATALGFTLSGGAIVLLGLRARPALRGGSVGLLGALAVALGVIALSGYFTGITLAYTWGQFTRMAVHTASGFIVLGIGLIAAAWRQDLAERPGHEAPLWLPLLVGTGAAAVTFCLWQALIVQQNAQRALITHIAAGGPLLHTQALLLDGALAAGLLLSALLAGAVALTQMARRRARALDRANTALTQARDALEERVGERTAELAGANTELARANKALRDVLVSVTEGRFRLCENQADLPLALTSLGEPVPLLEANDIPALRHRAREAAHHCGLSRERREDLELAVSEAAMNAVVHCGGGLGQIYGTQQGTVQIWVMDEGNGIAMENLPRATLERGFTTAGTLGHGFWLMLNVVDRLWLLTGTGGTTVVLEQSAVAPEPPWLSGGLLSEADSAPLTAER